jgi:ketosteroid isomerase-like protein
MTEPAGTNTATPREVVERVHRLAMVYDIEGEADLFAPDGVLEWPFAPAGAPRRLQGREEIRAVLGPLARRVRQAGTRMTGFHNVVVHETLDPEVIIVEFEAHGEVEATGSTYELPYIQVFRVRDGEIVWFRDYFGAGTAQALEAAFDAA